MKKAPSLFTVMEIKEISMSMGKKIGGEWVPGRPLGFYNLKHRLKYAWGVFVGKYDAIKWPKGQ